MDINITLRKPYMRPVDLYDGAFKWMCYCEAAAGYGATWEEAYEAWVWRR